MIKLFIIFTIWMLGFASSADPEPELKINSELMEKVMSVAEACKIKVNATDDDFKQLIDGSPNKTHAANCLNSCVMKDLNVVDSNWDFVRSGVLEYIKQYTNNDENLTEFSISLFDTCYEKTKRTYKECDDYAEYHKCITEEAS